MEEGPVIRLVTEFDKYAESIALLSVEREALTNNVGDLCKVDL